MDAFYLVPEDVVIQYIRNRDIQSLKNIQTRIQTTPTIIKHAFATKQMDIIRLLCDYYDYTHGNMTMGTAAIAYGTVDDLQFIHENGALLQYTQEDTRNLLIRMAVLASGNGELQKIQYLHEYCGCELTVNLLLEAIKHGHLPCVQYLHTNDCPSYIFATSYAMRHGQLECLKYLHEHGFPWVTHSLVLYPNKSCIDYAQTHGYPFAT